jgi:FixJ family two-component response regulator
LLQARGSKLPVIAITGRSDLMLKERVIRAGAFTLLDKPVADDMLLGSLARALTLAECRGY